MASSLSASSFKGPIKSERNRAAATSGSISAGPASSTSSAFHKKRAQGRPSFDPNDSASDSNKWRRRGQESALSAQRSGRERGTPAHKGQAASQPSIQEDAEEQSSEEGDNTNQSDDDIDVRSKTSLSLAGHELPTLSALVDTLSQFRYLQRLDLSSISPSEASPSGLSNLTWLAKAVFRSKASDKGKSRAFGDNLTWLNLGCNSKLTSEACIGLEALEELCVLNLSHCALTTVPPSINPLRNLKALMLNNNSIIGLPKTFPHLPELNSLILSHNEIESLPASFPASLPALKKLSLGHNKLSGPDSLPDFSLCLSLREVRLNDNPDLGVLPAHVKKWGKGADGKTAPGLELLEVKGCGLNTWESLSSLVEKEDEKEIQPRLRRKGLTQLLLKGNRVAELEDYRKRILSVHPTLRVLDNERLQPRVKSAEKEVQEAEDDKPGKKAKGRKQQERPQRDRWDVEANGSDVNKDEDDDEAAQMAAEMRALRRGGGKPAPSQRRQKAESEENSDKEDNDDDDDDEAAAAMAAEMRALRRGAADPLKNRSSSDKKGADKTQCNGKNQDKFVGKKADKSTSKNVKAESKQVKKFKDYAPATTQGDDNRSKPKHKRGTRSGKKVNKDDLSYSTSDPKVSSNNTSNAERGSGNAFFETVDEAAEKARLAPIYELSKKRAKIASGRTEVAEGVLEDATSTLSKARQRESKGRMELEMDHDHDNAARTEVKRVKGSGKKGDKGQGEKEREDKVVVNTSVAGIVDLRKQAKGKDGKKRKADDKQSDAGKKKAKASLPFMPANARVEDGVGTGADAWGHGGAWA
ncbi:uncharacterized protein MEPE_01815 [Melanopsichium pennsylvanicum]|uniref:L domain-like protein n=2 Tax=Melanopsichium pennsylvanicum TaxID=63383 RepID=A0AAJ4XIA1_9BASI|nr:adenylate cyclase fragment [Melanopsichium pennsylvanicum 4]SNX83109.1 uncharacterized protein MEPE_01815 [Melanopsichium pennsylvanicum]